MKRDLKRRATHRLRIIAGQIRGLERMVAAEKYCIDVIHQSLAAKEALSGFEDLILENHLATHVAEQMRTGRQARAIRELLPLYRLSKRQ